MTTPNRPKPTRKPRWTPIIAELSLREETPLAQIRAAGASPATAKAMARRLGREGAPFSLVRRHLGDSPEARAAWFDGAREERLAAGLDPLDPVPLMLEHVAAAARRAS